MTESYLNFSEIWRSLANYLQTITDRSLDVEGFMGHCTRILKESGPNHLIASALSNSFDKDCIFVEFGDLSKMDSGKPVICWNSDGIPYIVLGRTFSRKFRVIRFNQDGDIHEINLKKSHLRKKFLGGALFENRVVLDVWNIEKSTTRGSQWFWDAIKPLYRNARYLILAAIIGNILALSASLFALQVWDRVVPAQSFNTLTVLMIGVGCAMLLELSLRLLRARLIDEVGGDIDFEISNHVFSHMISLKSDERPQSLGAMAAQVREINTLREAVSSSVLNAAIDLPFTVIFLLTIYLIASSLIYPIIVGILIIIVLCVIAQFPLSVLAKEGLEEATVRNGLIVESVLKAEELKLQQAEQTMLLRWGKVIESGNSVSKSQRRWRNILMNFTQFVQQSVYVVVVAYGALLIIDGNLSMGQVIACSILTNRAIAPMGQFSSVMSALQNSIMAKNSIDDLIARRTDIPNKDHLRRELKKPDYVFRNVRYTYPETENGGLVIPKLNIQFGEKIGVLGKIGSGKSTLLRVLSGLGEPSQGTIALESTDMTSIHPDDLRRAIGFQSQSAALIRGTVRDNLLIAKPTATEMEMIHACTISGATNLFTSNSRGLDLMINEAGEGLSGGQRQSVLLARMILRDPHVALFDEPTASMDQQSEAGFIDAIKSWGKSKTLIIATHRMPPLKLCNRILLINEGRILLDGPRDEVLSQLSHQGGGSV